MQSHLGTVAWQFAQAASGNFRLGDEYSRLGVNCGRAVWWQLLCPPRSGDKRLAVGTHSRDERMRRLESILFLAREPLSSRKLSQYANLADATEARTLIRRLNELYDQSGRAFRIEEIANGFQLLTRPQFGVWLRRLHSVPREMRRSAPALEPLAVVAYRQPIGRAGIEAIRGVSCGEILRQLMERDLVRIHGRSDELGRPYLYGTTKRFLQLFGLKSLDLLPRAAELRSGPEGQATQFETGASECVSQQVASAEPDREKEEESDVTATMFPGLSSDELSKHRLEDLPVVVPCCSDENDEDHEDEDDDELEDDDYDEDEFDDDFEDDDDEYDDEFDDDDEGEDDEDFEDDEWEEVEDDDVDEEEEWDDEDDDWDDEDEEEDEEEDKEEKEDKEADWE
jgi:segregation and condensation protein B